ncbi:rho GTPase-activating protein 190 isoform X1 [Melanaphis sacchari]|uniref:rho GTPase-activating protein 190 isoform X1 n=1 Tax=Melanaphis sacchari TaxID=742174 RepID=UPI000DC14C57|nr:rho GTPase-activating protein 190 isoform X1 [Melanaphis sacchari]XP_025200482.1 rho GTPase-activating protein 190 isoform X1 [Melanaphis sacchari]
MAKKNDTSRWINVSVVGLSGTEKEKGAVGIGKSCLCNRFMRFFADDFNVDHISVLSQSDFSGRVVNNDHFLYWGDVTKTSEEGVDFTFQVIEQTEFIDDSSFQPFKGGKMEPYTKRCAATKITSAEKLMYICKNQLGIEKEYEQKVLPDGKFNVDGFLCVFDVSVVPSRSIEKQLEAVTNILINVIKTKKPVVLVTTKNDEFNEAYVREVEKLVSRKEFKGAIPIVETSAHQNINVDTAFIALAHLIDRFKGRTKIVPYLESVRMRKEVLENTTDAYQTLIQSQVTDYRALWSQTSKKISKCDEYIKYREIFGSDKAQRLFRRHVKMLKDEQVSKRVQNYMEMLPDILQELVPEISTLKDGDWPTVQKHIKEHPDFNHYFYKCPDDIPWTECELELQEEGSERDEKRIPCDVLETGEAESVFKNHANNLQLEQNRQEWKKQFKQLLQEAGYVTPGKPMSEVRVLFMGRECFEALSHDDCQYIYDKHQKSIIEKAKHNFQELLLEHADLFYHFKSIAPTGTITQDDIKEITDDLKEDSRYKALDRLDQDRKLMLFQHLGFVHCPIREHCPAFPNCMDALIEKLLSDRVQKPTSGNNKQWMIKSDNNLHLVILGSNGLADEFSTKLKAQCDNKEYELDNQIYKLKYRVINGDVNLSQNSFQTPDFKPNGCVCVYSNSESFEYIRDSLEKTLLSNLEKDDKLPFQGLPIILLYISESGIGQKDSTLQKEGQSLADSLQCPFIDMPVEDGDSSMFDADLISNAMKLLVESITHRIGFLNEYQSIMDPSDPDIRIIMCMFCDDPYSVESILAPLLSHQCCYLSGDRSIILETFLGSSKRKVEVIMSSYHGANAFREELVHGFILSYYAKRKASLATLNGFSCSSFSTNTPNLPIQIMAITEPVGTNSFHNDISQQLLNDGSSIADRLKAQFVTLINSSMHKSSFYTPFFKDVWEKKSEIEQAFHMEEPTNYRKINPLSKIEYSKMNLSSHDGSSNNVYGRLPCGITQDDDSYSLTHSRENLMSPSDDSDTFSPVDNMLHVTNNNLDKQGGGITGFQVFPRPTTPPEPAPPDHAGLGINNNSQMIASNSSLDEITSDVSGSRESLATHDSGWVDDSVFMQCTPNNENPWMNSYSKHAFTTGRHMSKSRIKNSNHTMKQPGKLNMKDYTLVTDAISRMNLISGKEQYNRSYNSGGSSYNCAPLATPENVDLGSEYAQVKDAMPGHYPFDGDYSYTLVQDNLAASSKHKLRHRREKGRPNYSDSDSDWSSIERREPLYNSSNDTFSKLSRRSATQKRSKKKRTAIPVATPKVPSFNISSNGCSMNFNSLSGQLGTFYSEDPSNEIKNVNNIPTAHHQPNSDSSTDNSDEKPNVWVHPSVRLMEKRSLRYKRKQMVAPQPPVIPSGALSNKECHNITESETMYSTRSSHMHDMSYNFDEESSLDVSSPRCLNSPSAIGNLKGKEDDKSIRRKEKQRVKEEIKLEKRRLKEEKLRKIAEEREKKKKSKVKTSGSPMTHQPTLENFVQSENNVIPLLLEKCVKYIEEEGLVSEGLYRVPGNRSHVELLFQRFEDDNDIDITNLDIPVNAVATALKDFFSKKLPPLFTEDLMDELEDLSDFFVSVKADRSCRLMALRNLLKKLPNVNFEILKFIFRHFVKVAEHCKINSMDSKNLAICWWPTLLPIEFNDMGRFEQLRPHLEDTVQTMIDQYPFLFCGKDAFVMV